MKPTDAITYRVVKKGNGKFAPRMHTEICGGVWFKSPYEYDNIEGAIEAIKKEKLENEKQKTLNKEEIVFEL